MENKKLFSEHYSDLHIKSGLSPETIEQAGFATIVPFLIPYELGYMPKNLSSMYKIPYLHTDNGYCRYRCFHDAGKEGPKYLQKSGSKNRLYFPPQIMQSLGDASVPLYITEGEKKALKAAQEGLCCIGLSGLWNWSDGNKNLIRDFELIKFEGRQVFIIPDNDWQKPNKHGYKKNLVLAVELLAHKLKKLGALVSIINLPEGDEKIGLDNYLCAHSVDDLQSLKETKILDKKTKKGVSEEEVFEMAGCMNLFHDQYREPYVFINNETIKITSSDFKYFISKECYTRTGQLLNDTQTKKIINMFAGMAIHACSQHELFVRAAKRGNAIYYDLCDGNVVVIRSDSWFITKAPILFRRYSHQQKQVHPVKNGDSWRIFNFLNIRADNQLLVLSTIISNFLPDIPHPIFHPYGPQGSGKSSLCIAIKKLCDPSEMELVITPKDRHELVQTISHHHVCLFDNLSSIQSWVSDILAMACSGAGFSKRKLYSDDEDMILKVKRCIGINGIDTLIKKPDLMDRAILLPLERIASSKRKVELELWTEFEAAKAEILGGMFDALAKAISIYPDVKLSDYPRMADFCRWGYAIAVALGRSGDEFLKQYQENIRRQNEEVIQNNTLAQAVLRFMEDKPRYRGTIQEFYNEIHPHPFVLRDDTTFPKHPNRLRKALNQIRVNLEERGITFRIGEFRSNLGVLIVIFKNL